MKNTSRCPKCGSRSKSYTLFLRFLGLGKDILLAILVLPDTKDGALHEPAGAQQGQDDIPHDGEVIAVTFVCKREDISLGAAREIMGSEQAFYRSMYVLQHEAPSLHNSLVKRKFHIHFVSSPIA